MVFTGLKIKWMLSIHRKIFKVRSMQIPCISCQSRFRLDSRLIKATGSLVRCSKCKYIFRVYPPDLNDEPIVKDNKIDQSIPNGHFEVEPAKIENGPVVKTSGEMNGYRIDQIASIEAFEEEEENPEVEDIEHADLSDLSEYDDMIDWGDFPKSTDTAKNRW